MESGEITIAILGDRGSGKHSLLGAILEELGVVSEEAVKQTRKLVERQGCPDKFYSLMSL